ncbi:MAG: 3-phosphoshikimate 1-carboxyvinyltransferase [Planctomycetaceae bacterium]|nr:3-phosphoshikimate 1-carboxyvinyltransferase [Planctomycetaceae bacterium]
MELICRPSRLRGSVEIPGSKSHTIRAVAIASLAEGDSRIAAPLWSDDAEAAAATYRALGATIDTADPAAWRVRGTGGEIRAPADVIDVGNSGTTMRIALGSATLLREGIVAFTGDEQIQRRPLGPLVQSLNDLGANVTCTRGNGSAPVSVGGRLRGGQTSIEAVTSQFLSSLLMCAPLGDGDSIIDVPLLNERPYVGITLNWLERAGIALEHDGLDQFRVPGGQRYRPLDVRVPADFSSATFFLAAGALGDNDVTSLGLDMDDTQGDKAVVDYLRQMGAVIDVTDVGVHVRPSADGLRGCELDLNAAPDALPMMAVVGCFASGQTKLVNVPQARVKETDRIAVMAAELTKMGASVRELDDGLMIEQSELRGAGVSGHDDHRVVMALAVAGCLADGETRIDTAEAINVTFPTFVESLTNLGAAAAMVA